MITTEQNARIAVIAGTRENAFAPFLEDEFRKLGVETSGLPEGEILSEHQVSGVNAVVFVVDKGFAAAWGRLSSGEFDRYGFRNIQDRFWVTDQAHQGLADDLRKKLDPDSPPILIEGSYDRNAASSLAKQIVDELQSSPASKAHSSRLEDEEQLQSGDATLRELLSSVRYGSNMVETDREALKFGSALAAVNLDSSAAGMTVSVIEGESKLTSLSVLFGYLLSASATDETAGSALGQMVGRLLGSSAGETKLPDRVGFLELLGLGPGTAIEQRAASEGALDRTLSPQLGKMLSGGRRLLEETNPNIPFDGAYLLACVIGKPGEEIDRSAIKALERLGSDPRQLRPMFRDWITIHNPTASAELFDHVLGVTAEEAKGSYARDPLPTKADDDPTDVDRDKRIQKLRQDIAALERESVLPSDLHGTLMREDFMGPPRGALQKRINDLQAQLAALEEGPKKASSESQSDLMSSEIDDRDAGPSNATHNIPVTGPPGYNPEFCGMRPSGEVEDYLDVKSLAHRLAELVALRETKLPLAVGLFGNWGTGKSHFINLMDQHLKDLMETEKGRPPDAEPQWCREIVPIHFNAWHYLDTNLWASLVTEIFERLFAHLAPNKLAQVQDRLQQAGGATARAVEEVARAHAAASQAVTELQAAKRQQSEAETKIQGLVDNLRTLLPDLTPQQLQDRIVAASGIEQEITTLRELRGLVGEMHSLIGRLRSLGRAIWAPEARAWRLGWLAGALIVAPAISWWAANNLPWDWLRNARDFAKVALGALPAIILWLRPIVADARRRIAQMEDLESKASDAHTHAAETPAVQALKLNLLATEAVIGAAQTRLAEAQARELQLREELRDLGPGRRLSRFIEDRARSMDYNGQLGLVSLARRDFKELSDLFANADALEENMLKFPEDAARLEELGASIDRIVLFVDDLDRCQPSKVVDVLQAVHLLLAFPLFAVVVGVDQRCLRQSIEKEFEGLVSRDDGAQNGDHPATYLDYLEKIFHVPFQLPTMGGTGFANLIQKLTEPSRVVTSHRAKTQGVKREMGSSQSTTPTAQPADSLEAQLTKVAIEQPTRVHRQEPKPAFEAAIPTVPIRPSEALSELIGSVPLQQWERDALTGYSTLIRTPRAATRLLNTYRLVRAGLPAEDWDAFRGDEKMKGEFRVAMLLLAAAAGSPARARECFKVLRTAKPTTFMISDDPVKIKVRQWQQFHDLCVGLYAGIYAEPGQHLTKELFDKWLDRVERFVF